MLFNSYQFIFLYLPITLAVFALLGRYSNRLAIFWLALASLVFYGHWNLHDVPVLCASILFNFLLSGLISRAQSAHQSKKLLVFALVANLGALAYYKYSGFAVIQLASTGLDTHGFVAPVLPLGISFFTFTQIAFLVDCYQRRAAERNFSSYFLFVTYFPHLIAGPVLHHKEMMPQFDAKRTSFVDAEGIAVGLTMFAIGLFKKVVLADSVASYANQGFNAAASGVSLMPLEAWAAALSYTFQLYFDFSGYSDMAIGLSRMFGIRLPLNFDSPYKATSIADFWRRWHMTLSRFLRDYLYIPLGGNRNGPARRYVNLLTTMVLGGLWHGAGWTFIVWGALHGIFLCINQRWVAFRFGFVLPGVLAPLERVLAWMLTFLAVVVAWVFFRADNLATALAVCSAMFSGMPDVAELVYALSHPAQRIQGLATNLGGLDLLRLLALLGIAVLLPNSQQWLDRFRPALEQAAHVPMKKLQWVPHWALGATIGLLAGVAVSLISSDSAFLYFNF